MFTDTNPIYEFRGPWGIPIQLGSSIILLPLIYLSFGATPTELYYDLIFLALIVVSILLHELGHAWACLIQSVPVRRIMLHGGGGFCERSRSATRYEQEFIVAMGPVVNLAIWAMASLAAPMLPHGDMAWMLEMLAWINLFLAILNLMPVMPLDGGKLFQLGMTRLVNPQTATRICGGVGLAVAILWLPLMAFSYVSFGLVLLLMPAFAVHWRMLRGGP